MMYPQYSIASFACVRQLILHLQIEPFILILYHVAIELFHTGQKLLFFYDDAKDQKVIHTVHTAVDLQV